MRPCGRRLTQTGGLLGPISQGHHYFGFKRGERDGSRRRLVPGMGAGGAATDL